MWKELRAHKQKTAVFKTLDTGDIVREQGFSYAFGGTITWVDRLINERLLSFVAFAPAGAARPGSTLSLNTRL